MKLANIALTTTALFASSVVLAGTLTASSNITFLAFDGQKVKKNQVLQVNQNSLHQVVFDVSSIYQSGSDSHFYESQPVILTFNGSKEDIKILAPNLRHQHDVERFKSSPVFKLETVSGKPIEFKQDYLKGEGFMPNARIMDSLATYNASEGVAAVKQFASEMSTSVLAANNHTAKSKVTVQGENIAEQQLQYWFQQADKETQQRFLKWADKR